MCQQRKDTTFVALMREKSTSTLVHHMKQFKSLGIGPRQLLQRMCNQTRVADQLKSIQGLSRITSYLHGPHGQTTNYMRDKKRSNSRPIWSKRDNQAEVSYVAAIKKMVYIQRSTPNDMSCAVDNIPHQIEVDLSSMPSASTSGRPESSISSDEDNYRRSKHA